MGDVGSDRYLNRELSWLEFNARVLALAEDTSQPLLERVKFLAIFSQNLDEFFQVRVAGLKDQVAAGINRRTPDGRTPAETLEEIRDQVAKLTSRQEQVLLHSVVPALAEAGIRLSRWVDLESDDRAFLSADFEDRVFPALTPLAVDPGHPFPYISDLSLNLAVLVSDRITSARRFARVKVPPLFERFVALPDGERFVPLEQVIAAHLGRLFPGMTVEAHSTFRVTRNADLTLEDEDADDLLELVEDELRRRRFGGAVRLEIDVSADEEVGDLLLRELDMDDDDVFASSGLVDLSGLWDVAAIDRPDLLNEPLAPGVPARLSGEEGPTDFFAELQRGDVIFQMPYDSFAGTVEEFIRQSADDPGVLAIKLTLYRTSGDGSIVDSLIRAAESGKQVAVLVELKARFDEQANVAWARRLEKAGVHVTYGLVGLKVHTKVTLVVRQEPDGIRRYCHIGTGNYNAKTAKLYEDLGVLTCDEQIGEDLSNLFNYLTGYARDVEYQRLLVAPDSLRSGFLDLIEGEAEAGPGRGRIVARMNSLVDAGIIDALYAASEAGAEIDLIVRGICCLRPEVPGLSDRIRVRSIVGRYLEHSRLWCFGNGEGAGQPAYLLGSADWMTRNLDNRVEVVTPVLDRRLRVRLREVLEVNLADDTLAWRLRPDGDWEPPPGTGRVETHLRLHELERARTGAR